MAQDFMNTQTGGEGETIQLQTDIKSTPEQFDVKLPQQAQDGLIEPSNPSPQPQVATVPNEGEVVEQPPIPFASTQTEVTEQVTPSPTPSVETTTQVTTDNKEVPPVNAPTEEDKQKPDISPSAGTEVKVDMLPTSISMIASNMNQSQFADNNPYLKNKDLLTPTLDLINQGEVINYGGQAIEDDSDIIFSSQAEREEYEDQKQLNSLDPAVQSYVQAVSQAQPEEDPTLKQMNEIITKGKKQGGYEGILDRVASSVQDESTFGDVDVPTVKFDKLTLSSNYKNWTEIMGVTEDQISEIAEGAIINQGFEDKANTIGNILSSIDNYRTNINSLEESLNSGIITPETQAILNQAGPTWVQPGSKIDKTTKYAINDQINKFKKEERAKRKELIDVNNQSFGKKEKYIPPKAPVTKLEEFENRVNTDLKSIYAKKWEFVGKDQGIPFYKSPVNLGLSSDGFTKDNISTPTKIKEIKDQAKWLDQEGRKLINQSVAQGKPEIFFNNPNAKNLNPGLVEYARDLFEVEYNKDFKKNGGVDPYTYDGFKRVAAKLAKENSTKLNLGIADDANDVVANVTKLNDQWVSKNQKILTSKINDVKTSMDEVLSADIMSEIQRNPAAAAIRDKYSQMIYAAPSKEEAAKLNDQMMSELKQIPAIAKSFGEYKENLDSAVFKLQADYNREWYTFRQDLYTNSINDLKNKISKTTMDIYRGGVNNDLNIYQGVSNVKDPDKVPLGANGVVKSQKFKEASYYEKRKMISDQWELEKSAIINYTNTYIKRNVEKYPANKEEAGKHWSEWTGYRAISDKEKNQWLASMPERTGADAKNRYVFYAIDDLLYPNNSKPTVFGIKSFADAELDKIRYLEKKFGFEVGDHIGDYGDVRQKLPISQQEEQQLLSTKKMLQEIVSHPETDQEWYTELMNGVSSGFDIPILGAFVGIQRNQNLKAAMDKYQDGTFDSFDISMTEAQAALNKLNEIRPPSTAYQIGAGLGFTTTFMLEMAMTGGVNQIGRSVGTKVVQTVANLGKSSADDVVRVAAERAAPETIQRIEKISAFLGGGIMEGATSPRAYESFTQNMIQNVTVQELGTFDGLVAEFDRTSKDEFSEFFKAYGNWIGMATIERLGGHLPMTNVSKEVLEYMGTETFLKRSMVGAWFRSAGFKSVDEASEFLATTSMPWSNLTSELGEEFLQGSWESIMYGEQMFGPERQEDGSKEIKFFGMTPEEVKVTAASVALFGAGSTMVRNARASISGDSVTIEAQDTDGTSQIVQIDKESWKKFNGIVSDPNLSWQAVSKMLDQSDLSVEQQRAMATVFIKTRGLEILADKDYQQWKEENKAKIEENQKLRDEFTQKLEEEESKLTEEDKALRDYQFMTTGLQYDNEGNPMNFWESLNAKDSMYMTINLLEKELSDANMPIVEVNENGETVETNTRDKAETIVKRKKKVDADKEKTPKGKKTAKVVEPQKTKEEPSSFTEPVDLLNTEENDQKNKPGLPSEVGEGQKPVETQPVVETSQEAVSPSGVVQEEQKITVNPSQGYSFEYASESEIPSELRSVNPISKSESQRGRGRNASKTIRLTFSGQQLIDAGLGQEEVSPSGVVQETGQKVESGETANPFEELNATKGLRGTAKTKAVKDLKAKYGEDYNRISKIDTNFARIVKELEKNNLINKDC